MAKRTPPRDEWDDPTSRAAVDDEQGDDEAVDGPTTVYYLHSRDHELLYVGITASELGIARFRQHADGKDWWGHVAYISVEHMPTRAHAVQREAAAIEKLRPKHNIVRPKRGICTNCGERTHTRTGRECNACAKYRTRRGMERPRRLASGAPHPA